MAAPGLDVALKYLLMTSTMVVTSKVAYIMLRRYRNYAQLLRYKKIKPVLTKLYSGVNAYKLSVDYRKEHDIGEENFVYGEIMFTSFANILNITQPLSGEIFYDLGCGSGKAVFTTALLYDYLDVRGIEILKPLYDLCITLLAKFKKIVHNKHPNNIQFFNDDLLTLDFSDADIVFINATCFNADSWKIITKGFEKLKKGARVIISTKKLESNLFENIHSGIHLMSWGQNSINIYKKIR